MQVEQNARRGKAGRDSEDAPCETAVYRSGRIAGRAARPPEADGAYKLFWEHGSVQSYGAERPQAIVDRLVTDGAQERGKFRRAEEPRYGFWQVRISGPLAGN